jgi:hypothetical protein
MRMALDQRRAELGLRRTNQFHHSATGNPAVGLEADLAIAGASPGSRAVVVDELELPPSFL